MSTSSTIGTHASRSPRTGTGVWSIARIALVSAAVAAIFALSPLLGVMAMGGVGLVGLGLLQPARAFALLVFLIPMLSSVARGRFVPVLAPNEILLLLLAGLFLVRSALQTPRLPAHGEIRRGFAVFTLLGAAVPLAAFALRGGALAGEDVKECLIYVQYYLLFILALGCIRTRENIALVLRTIMVASIPVALLGILQILGVPLALALVRDVFTTPEHLERFGYLLTKRATSTLGAWNGLAVYLSVVAFLALSLFYVAPRRERDRADSRPLFGRAFLVTVLAVDVAGVVASGSHTGLVTLVVGFALILSRTGRIRHLVAWALLALPGALLLWDAVRDRFILQFVSSESAVPLHLFSRWIFWTIIGDELMHGVNLIVGIRPSIPPDAPWVTEDNYYIHLLARGGLVFFAGFVYLVGAFVRLARRGLRADDALTHALAVTFVATLVQLAIIGVTGTFFRFSGYAEMIWILAALTTITLALERR